MDTPTNQAVQGSISAVTNGINHIAMFDTPGWHDTQAQSSSDDIDIDSMVIELSSLYANLLKANTFSIAKLTTDLNEKRKRSTLVRFLFDGARLKIQGAETFFTRLSYEQYTVLFRILNEFSLPRFWRCLKLCADIELGQCRHLPTQPGLAPSLLVRIHNLPDELFDTVQQTVIPSLLMSSMKTLKGLPLDLLEYIQRGIVWVIDDGPPSVSSDLIYQMPTIQIWNILAVRLRFTLSDLYTEGRLLRNGIVKKMELGLDEAMARLSMTGDLMIELTKIWHEKYTHIAMLSLQHFTLDTREAFGSDGTFLGLDVARTLPKFFHGPPPSFTVLAPTEDLGDEILRVLT